MPKPPDKPGKNKSPIIADQNWFVLENSLDGTSVYDVVASDPENDPLTYSIVDGNGEGAFSIDPITGSITVQDGSLLDHETLDEYQLQVDVTDGKRTSSATITIAVNDVNEAPTDISLSSITVAPDIDGAVVGDLSAIDPDEGDVLTFSIDDQASSFELSGGQLRLKAGESLALGSTDTVTVTVTDSDGLTYDEDFTITAADAPPPPPFSGVVDLGDRTAWDGFSVFSQVDDATGAEVSSAGDVNGDGIDDVLITGAGSTIAGDGGVYVIYGQAAGFTFTDINVANLAPLDGFRIFSPGEVLFFGTELSSAGDINNDGFDDLIIGSSGKSYVVFGKTGPITEDINVSNLAPDDGFVILGDASSVSSAGDVNDDGIDDLIIGNPTGDGSAPNGDAGEAYVIFGKDGNFTDIDLAQFDPEDGFRILGADSTDSVGRSVSSAGDINGDDIDDLLIGAPGVRLSNGKPIGEGVTYVIFGQENKTDIDLASLSPEDGFRILGVDKDDWTGHSVSNAGDVNNDGFDDLIVGAMRADGDGNLEERAGESYVIFGKDTGFTDIDLANLNPDDGIRIIGADAGDFAGKAVSSAGDVNGDGIDDLLVSAYRGDGADNLADESGEVYLIFGKQDLADIDLEQFTFEDGVVFIGAEAGDRTGWAVSGAGDVNDDGFDDLVFGSFAETAYIVFGEDFGDTSMIDISSQANEPLWDEDFIL